MKDFYKKHKRKIWFLLIFLFLFYWFRSRKKDENLKYLENKYFKDLEEAKKQEEQNKRERKEAEEKRKQKEAEERIKAEENKRRIEEERIKEQERIKAEQEKRKFTGNTLLSSECIEKTGVFYYSDNGRFYRSLSDKNSDGKLFLYFTNTSDYIERKDYLGDVSYPFSDIDENLSDFIIPSEIKNGSYDVYRPNFVTNNMLLSGNWQGVSYRVKQLEFDRDLIFETLQDNVYKKVQFKVGNLFHINNISNLRIKLDDSKKMICFYHQLFFNTYNIYEIFVNDIQYYNDIKDILENKIFTQSFRNKVFL